MENQLTIEQEFLVRQFATQVQGINRDQAEEMLLEMYRQHLVQQSLFRAIIRRELPELVPPRLEGLG